jgi:hypothetical protein
LLIPTFVFNRFASREKDVLLGCSGTIAVSLPWYGHVHLGDATLGAVADDGEDDETVVDGELANFS